MYEAKKLGSNSLPVVVLALLVVLGIALTNRPARDPVTIYGSDVDLTYVDDKGNNYPFGKVTLTIRGQEYVGTVLVITGDRKLRGDGFYAPAAVHIFDFGNNGSFTTAGAEDLVPTDEDPLIWIVQGDMEITETSGVFEGVFGELRGIGKVNRHPEVMEASFQAKGVVSGYED